MHAILFCPATFELFLPDHARSLAGSGEAVVAPVLLSRLRAHGWPARARLLSPKAPQSAGSVPGTLVQLIDALPLLAQPPDAGFELAYPPSLRAWGRAARLALELVRRGRMTFRLGQRGRGRPSRTTPGMKADASQAAGAWWEARWHLCSPESSAAPLLPDERAAVLRIVSELPDTIAIAEDARASTVAAALSGPRLLQRFLDACADLLVREASRRGALVRLRGCSAYAWEQRLVRALGEDRASFFWAAPNRGEATTTSPPPAGAEDPVAIAAEVNAWAAAQARAMEQSGTLSLLASPGHWSAAETLADVQRRLIRPATLLAQTLLDGQPAPRTLTWRPSSPAPTLPMLAGATPRPLLRTSQRVAA
jgi:hypothetical protein